MDKRQIHDLLRRYLNGECDAYEAERIRLWYERLHKADEIRLSDEEKVLLEDKLWENIRIDLAGDALLKKARSSRAQARLWYSGIAAMVLAAFGLIWYFRISEAGSGKREEMSVPIASGRMYQTNEAGEPVTVLLEDGSRVTLSPGSRLEYPQKFESANREVILEGNAFFEIASNPEWPFLVHSGKLVTRVLGTSFWIRKHQKNKSLEVEVVSGKVSVFENTAQDEDMKQEASTIKSVNGVLLTPNQRATYFPENGYLLTGVVEEPVPVYIPAAAEMVFDNDNVKDIVPLLFKKFGIEILLAHDGLSHCTFTGDINGLPLYDALELVCKSIGAEYEIKGSRILINGIGCD